MSRGLGSPVAALWVAVLCCFSATGIAFAAERDGSPKEAKRAAPATPLPLAASRGADPRITDARGREVLLRGVNVNQLGDYFQDDPSLPTVFPLRRSDFERIARLGFNSVRLVLNWSRLEPQRGAFNRAYVKRIARAVGQAERRGLHVILDMHQDAWGKTIGTPAGATCLPGSRPAIGWDGAPAWATITDDASTCIFEKRELSPAVTRAWRSFWEDREGIQTRLIRTWARLARAFADEPAVAGYDLLNEPNPGFLDGKVDGADMGRFYGRAIEAIRAAEGRRKGGFQHIVFFEPSVAWSGFSSSPVPPPDFTADRNIVFAPHIYAESISPVPVGESFDLARSAAESYGTTFWSGEWGYFGDPAEQQEVIARYARAEDEYLAGGAWWSWRQACGDPHVIGEPGAAPDRLSPSLIRYECPSGRSLGIPAQFRRVLSRPTVRAAPGRLLSLRSDPLGIDLRASGDAGEGGRRCGLQAFVPARAGRPAVSGSGLSRVRTERVLGDWRVRACVRGEWSLGLGPRR